MQHSPDLQQSETALVGITPPLGTEAPETVGLALDRYRIAGMAEVVASCGLAVTSTGERERAVVSASRENDQPVLARTGRESFWQSQSANKEQPVHTF